MTITGGTKLADDEIERMVKEAETHANEDKARREEVEARNQADNVIYQTEKSLTENSDKLDESTKSNVTSALDDAKEALKGEDVGRIKQTTEVLMTTSQQIAQAVYQNAQNKAPGSQSAGGTTQSEDDVVDAEVVDEDDEGKEQSA